MQKRYIGKTGLAVSVIGLGTVKFGRNEGVKYPTAFSLPTDQALTNLLSLAHDLGINLIDTAPAYGKSEERLGKLLAGSRDKWVISTKVGEKFVNGESCFDFSRRTVLESIHCSLKRLRTDYLDIVLVHSNGEDERIIDEELIFVTLDDLKKEGKIRAFGMSSKTVRGGFQTLDHADLAMVSFSSFYRDEQAVIDYAYQKQKGIFIKKALESGHLSKIGTCDPILFALQFIFKQKGITSVIIGTINQEHLQENVEKAMFLFSSKENLEGLVQFDSLRCKESN